MIPRDWKHMREYRYVRVGAVLLWGGFALCYIRDVARQEAHRAENRCMDALEFHEEYGGHGDDA